jgi:hypothetical protein
MRGGSEGGITPGRVAIADAIVDALAGFGVEHIDLSATDEPVWKATAAKAPRHCETTGTSTDRFAGQPDRDRVAADTGEGSTIPLTSRRPAQGVFSSQRQGIPLVGSQAFSLRDPDFFANHIRAQHHRDHLVLRVPTAHAFTAHAAIGGDDQALRRDVAQRFADQTRDLVRSLDLQGMVVNKITPITTFLSVIT